jgi:glycosyltransferase involved in cell wall biosynthesis
VTVRLRVGIVCDLLEEAWPSMDLVAQQLGSELRTSAADVDPVLLRPAMRRRATRLPFLAASPQAGMLDRLINRHIDYPRWLSGQRDGIRVFHIVDHSYAQLVLTLPAGRTVVTCHDLDAFRCVIQPDLEPRWPPFRALVRRTLRGLQQAARVVCVSAAVRDELIARALVEPGRLAVVPNGVDCLISPHSDKESDAAAARLIGPRRTQERVLLHVGSSIDRKRIDVLLRAFALVAADIPGARLVKVGGLTQAQRELAETLGVLSRITELPFVDRRVLAAVYRRASVVVVPSDREGFGLPVLEAQSCGVPVIASDLAALRETGGRAAIYCPPGVPAGFAGAILSVLHEAPAERRRLGIEQASGFSWERHARLLAAVYRDISGDGVRRRMN